jgi:hypothetical protein
MKAKDLASYQTKMERMTGNTSKKRTTKEKEKGVL